MYKIDRGLMEYGFLPVLPMPEYETLAEAKTHLKSLCQEYLVEQPSDGAQVRVLWSADETRFDVQYFRGWSHVGNGDIVSIRETQ